VQPVVSSLRTSCRWCAARGGWQDTVWLLLPLADPRGEPGQRAARLRSPRSGFEMGGRGRRLNVGDTGSRGCTPLSCLVPGWQEREARCARRPRCPPRLAPACTGRRGRRCSGSRIQGIRVLAEGCDGPLRCAPRGERHLWLRMGQLVTFYEQFLTSGATRPSLLEGSLQDASLQDAPCPGTCVRRESREHGRVSCPVSIR